MNQQAYPGVNADFNNRAVGFKVDLEHILKKHQVELESDTYDGTFTLQDKLDRRQMVLNFQFGQED